MAVRESAGLKPRAPLEIAYPGGKVEIELVRKSGTVNWLGYDAISADGCLQAGAKVLLTWNSAISFALRRQVSKFANLNVSC